MGGNRRQNNWKPEEDYNARQGSVGSDQSRGGGSIGAEQLDQTLNRNSQAGEQGGESFASSFVEDSRDSAGRRGLEEEASRNDVEDSGVIFPFLDRATQEQNQEGNLNQEGNFGGNRERGEEGGVNIMGGSLGEDMVNGWKLRSEEETEYQTDIFS